jgi:hypothetical protein
MERFTNYLTLAANLGILVGLVFVFLQMRQNEALLRITLLNQHNESYIAADTAVGGETLAEYWAKSFEDLTNLTLAEMRALEAQTFSPLLRWSNLYRLYEAGLIEESAWRAEIQNDAMFYFTSPYGRAWWDTFSPTLHPYVLPPEIREQIDMVLANTKRDPAEAYGQIRAHMIETIRMSDEQ